MALGLTSDRALLQTRQLPPIIQLDLHMNPVVNGHPSLHHSGCLQSVSYRNDHPSIRWLNHPGRRPRPDLPEQDG